MVFSKIFESISGFFSPEESYRRANKFKIENKPLNQLQQGLIHLENRKMLMNAVSKKLRLLENFSSQKLDVTTSKELEYLAKLEHDYNSNLSSYSTEYKNFMEQYAKAVEDVKECKSKCLVNHPRGSSAWSYNRTACAAGCDLKGPYVSDCRDTYGVNKFTRKNCSVMTKNKCINGSVILGMDSVVTSAKLVDDFDVTLKDGCCACGGGAGGKPTSIINAKKIKNCSDVPAALGYGGSGGRYTKNTCLNAPIGNPQRNANLYKEYAKLVQKNEALIKTAKDIFKHMKKLQSRNKEIHGVMEENTQDIRNDMDAYTDIKAKIDKLNRNARDKTVEGQLEDAMLKGKSGNLQLIIWSILAILTILLAIQRIRK